MVTPNSHRVVEEITHEYPAVDKYRVRVLSKKGIHSLDIREYVNADKFEGFTRRGIRLTTKEQIQTLHDELADALARGWFEA